MNSKWMRRAANDNDLLDKLEPSEWQLAWFNLAVLALLAANLFLLV